MTQNGASSLNSEVLSKLVRIIHVLLYVYPYKHQEHGLIVPSMAACLHCQDFLKCLFRSFLKMGGRVDLHRLV
jgi:hypothetical protein